MNLEMREETDLYLEAIRANYRDWQHSCQYDGTELEKQVRETMIGAFYDALRAEEGTKYIKVVSGRSAHSFIVKQDGPKFRRGDILKAASWGTPAKNFARGNVIVKEYRNVQWTGA